MMRTAALFTFACALVWQVRAEEETAKERWVKVDSIGTHLIHLKKGIVLSADFAETVFQRGFPWIQADWRETVKARPENIEKPAELPLKKEDLKKPQDATPYATVLRFSEKEVVVVVLEPLGSELWHHYYECLACFRVPRNAEIDRIFSIDTLAKTYGATYEGLKQGDSFAAVKKALGEPDHVESSQAVGYFEAVYRRRGVTFVFTPGGVQQIKRK